MAALQSRRQRQSCPRASTGPSALGRRGRNSPRDAARPLGLRGAAGLQPGRRDALHRECRRDGDRLGHRREPPAGATVQVHARSGARSIVDRHPGRFSPDGRLIAVGLKERGIQLWNTTELSAGRRAPAGDRRRGQGAHVQSRRANTRRGHPRRHGDGLGRRVAIAPHWAVQRRRVAAVGVSFSADGTMLATAGSEGVRLWDTATGAALDRIGDAAPADDVAFSPTAPIVAFVRDGWVTAITLQPGFGMGERGSQRRDLGRGPTLADRGAAGQRGCP